jgi:hypothetical protein
VLREYPLESPPALPPLDDEWAGAPVPVRGGRRVRPREGGFDLGDGVALTELEVSATSERWLCALEEPCVVWEGTGPGEVTFSARLRLPDSELHVERAKEGDRFLLTADQSRTELLVGAVGGAVQVEERDGALQLTARATGRLRLVLLSAHDEADRERTLRALARKGVKGLVDQRHRHAEQLAALGVELATPEALYGDAIESAKQGLDELLAEDAKGHRALPHPDESGALLLALGLREPVRDLLRAPISSPELVTLFAHYAQWAGADEFVARHWVRALEEARHLDHRIWLPIAEALGDRVATSALIDGATAPHPQIPEEIEELFQPRPDALDGVLALAPRLPAGWNEMTLSRLRIGASRLDVRVRRRPAGIAVKVRVTHGPPLVVRLAPRLDGPATGILLGGEQLAGPEVRLTLESEEEGVWMV